MSGQPAEQTSSKQSKICSNTTNGCTLSRLRAPFSTEDQSNVLTTFKNSRQKSNDDIANPLRLFPLKPKPPREYEINPRMKTMYQYQYNDAADVRLGYCDNSSIEKRNEHFKRCQKHGRELCKLRMPEPPPRKYRSDRNKRVSEYTAEISYVGAKFMTARIHDHSQCGRLPKNCVHYIEF